jgi:DNA-binding GntR family transcriptional regulator
MRRLKREPASDLVVSALRTAILTGKLSPGHRIKPDELAAQLGVSRMPIRQALSILEREGLVQTGRWRGTVVTPLDAELIHNIYDLRGILERAVAAGVAQTSFETAPVRAIIAAGRQAASNGDITRSLELDLGFHTALYKAYDNPVLSDVMVGLWGHVRRVMHAAVISAGYRSDSWDEHEAIVDAIEARDPVRAAAVAGDHIASASRSALRNLEALNQSAPQPAGERAERLAPASSAAVGG